MAEPVTVADTPVSIFASNLGFPAGPLLLPDGNFLFVEMTPETGWIIWISADGKSRRVVARTGRPNGLAQDAKGNIWVTETAQRALLKLTLDGNYTVFAKLTEDRPFKFLNDPVIAPNGDIYVSDSGVEIGDFAPGGSLNADWKSLDYDGCIYRIDADSGEVELIDHGIRFANGLSFGPDKNLYVSETLSGSILRYPWSEGRVIGEKETFAHVIDPKKTSEFRGPDGMKFGADGRLYVAVFGQGDVTVLGKDGQVEARYEICGKYPTNLVFGHDGEKAIYVTEGETGTVRRIRVPTDGFALYT